MRPFFWSSENFAFFRRKNCEKLYFERKKMLKNIICEKNKALFPFKNIKNAQRTEQKMKNSFQFVFF